MGLSSSLWTSLFLCFLITSLTPSIAQSESEDRLWSWAKANKLYEDSQWLKLHRYRQRLLTSAWTSDISSPDFFISPQGRRSPKIEMEYWINALLKDKSLACRFPARFKWLKSKLPAPLADQLDHPIAELCPEYRKWRLDGQVKSISLVFATGYFGNPASYFGHPLVKFNRSSGPGTQRGPGEDLLDLSLNYGAMTPRGENPILYVLRGLLGGYHASFTHIHYFYHHHNYSETELRDLWEYHLNLSADEVEFLVDHSFELLGHHFPYYFFSDNCAYRVAELIDLVLPKPILSPYLPYAIPTSLFQRIHERQNSRGEPLIAKVSYRPSRQRRMATSYLHLAPKHRGQVRKILKGHVSLLDSALLESEDLTQRSLALETLLEYDSFGRLQGQAQAYSPQLRQQVLLERLKLPPADTTPSPQNASSLVTAKPNAAPHDGQRPMRLSLGVGHSSGQESWLTELIFRPALYDLLSVNISGPAHSELSLGQLHLAQSEQLGLRLVRFDVFSISTLNIGLTDLPGDGGWAWRMRVGLWNQNLSCRSCTVGGVAGGIGQAWSLGNKSSAYSLLNVQVQTDGRTSPEILPTPSLGLIFHAGSSWRSHLQYGWRFSLTGDTSPEPIVDIESRWSASPYWDMGIRYLEDTDRWTSLFLSHYW